jgi:hypothetical protein
MCIYIYIFIYIQIYIGDDIIELHTFMYMYLYTYIHTGDDVTEQEFEELKQSPDFIDRYHINYIYM